MLKVTFYQIAFLPDDVSHATFLKNFASLKQYFLIVYIKVLYQISSKLTQIYRFVFACFFCFLRKVYSTCNSVFATTDSETGICCMVHDETVIRSQRIHKSLTLCCVRFIRLYVSHYSAIRGLFFPAALNSLTGKHFAMQTSNSSIITFLNSKHFSKFITSAS